MFVFKDWFPSLEGFWHINYFILKFITNIQNADNETQQRYYNFVYICFKNTHDKIVVLFWFIQVHKK